MNNLEKFVEESNRIEGITSTEEFMDAMERTEKFLEIGELHIADVDVFNTAGQLRERPGMNVRVGNHTPPEGGQRMVYKLSALVRKVNDGLKPYKNHIEFENLHPYMDGNGRTGRVIWLWQMVNQKGYDISLGFLHCWYYQTLDLSK